MRKLTCATVLIASLSCGGAWAYGGGGGSSGCAEPKFFEPKPSGTVSSLEAFTFVASDNTDAATLTVEIGSDKVEPSITRRPNGDYDVKAILPQAVTQPGKIRIGVNAKSVDGCSGFQPWYVEVEP